MTHDNPSRQCSGQHETRTPSRCRICVVILLAALVLPALCPATAQAQQMKLLTPTTGWVTRFGSLYWTTDSGSHWTNITPVPPGVRYAGGVESVFFLNTQEGWVVVSYPDATVPLTEKALQTRKTLYDIAQTVDGGQTWSLLPLTYPQLPHWEQEAQGPPANMFFLDSLHGWLVMAMTGSSNFAPGKLLATDDGGRNWKWVNDPGTVGELLFTSTQDGWLAGGPGGLGLYSTHDGCKTWERIKLSPPPQSHNLSLAVYEGPPMFVDAHHAYVAARYPGSGGASSRLVVFSTSDGGRSWNPVKVLEDSREGGVLHIALADSVLLVPSGATPKVIRFARVHLTGELTSSVVVSGEGVLGTTFADAAHGLALAESGLLYTSDGGATWKNVTPRFTIKPAQPGAKLIKPHTPTTAVTLSSEAGSNHQREWQHFGTTRATPGGVPARADPSQAAGADRVANLSKQMLVLVNRDRQDPANAAETHGRARPLKWNEKLAAVALAHSRDMLRRRYFAHVDREGRTPKDRINAAGIGWRALAENIALNQTVADAENDLMDEPRFQQNHRGNILNPEYTDVGIGIVQAPNGDLYITQDFVAMLPRSGH
ncbi:MAG TPA: CAP domain-containing protein [Terriglobia bacterium]|nr:CAP domain-containing protein [Terriglobia bacterium]